MALDLTAFQAELARNTSLTGSIVTALNTLKSQVDNLTQQLSQAGVDPASMTALTDMQNTLRANDDTVAAILAGTQADQGGNTPAPSPEPSPAPSPAPEPAPEPAPATPADAPAAGPTS